MRGSNFDKNTTMKNLFFSITLMVSTSTFAQRWKMEIREMKGKIVAFAPGFNFAYNSLIFVNNNDTSYLSFSPKYGELIVSNFSVGNEIELRANVTIDGSLRKTRVINYFQDEILAIKMDGKWVELDRHKPLGRNDSKVFLERKVKDENSNSQDGRAFLLNDGVVAFIHPVVLRWNNVKSIEVNKKVSFVGFEYLREAGYEYPKWNPKSVYSFSLLSKMEGELKSYLYKQNYVYIGFVLKTFSGEYSFSFPSDMGNRIKFFFDDHRFVTVYHSSFTMKGQLDPPELHALASDGDTLKINEFGFYGGADVKHEHTPAEIEGKITSINRSAKGKIISVIVGNDCYIEVDNNMEKQLTNYLKQGRMIKVSGQERIKKEGEIYAKEYRIITPSQVTADGKVFFVNMIPY